jgi:hypothetical protein
MRLHFYCGILTSILEFEQRFTRIKEILLEDNQYDLIIPIVRVLNAKSLYGNSNLQLAGIDQRKSVTL